MKGKRTSSSNSCAMSRDGQCRPELKTPDHDFFPYRRTGGCCSSLSRALNRSRVGTWVSCCPAEKVRPPMARRYSGSHSGMRSEVVGMCRGGRRRRWSR